MLVLRVVLGTSTCSRNLGEALGAASRLAARLWMDQQIPDPSSQPLILDLCPELQRQAFADASHSLEILPGSRESR